MMDVRPLRAADPQLLNGQASRFPFQPPAPVLPPFVRPEPIGGVLPPREWLEAEAAKLEMFDSALWVYQADITNGAGGSGNHTYVVVPGAGNEMTLLYGSLFNGDTSGRAGRLRVTTDGTGAVVDIIGTGGAGITITAGRYLSFPTSDGQGAGGVGITPGWPFDMAGTMELEALMSSVGASDDSAFAMVARINGGLPTVTETGASTPTININTERVF